MAWATTSTEFFSFFSEFFLSPHQSATSLFSCFAAMGMADLDFFLERVSRIRLPPSFFEFLPFLVM